MVCLRNTTLIFEILGARQMISWWLKKNILRYESMRKHHRNAAKGIFIKERPTGSASQVPEASSKSWCLLNFGEVQGFLKSEQDIY